MCVNLPSRQQLIQLLGGDDFFVGEYQGESFLGRMRAWKSTECGNSAPRWKLQGKSIERTERMKEEAGRFVERDLSLETIRLTSEICLNEVVGKRKRE